MVPYKRPAADKSGIPVYQPSATTYQQLMQLQQPFVPVSCEYSSNPSHASTNTIYPNTSTAIPIAHNNIHHHLILNNNSSINNNNNNSNNTASNNTSNNIMNNNSNNNSISKLGSNQSSNNNIITSNSNYLTQYVTSANTLYSKSNSTVITSTAHSYLNKPQVYQVNHQSVSSNATSNNSNSQNALNASDQDNNQGNNNNNNNNLLKNSSNCTDNSSNNSHIANNNTKSSNENSIINNNNNKNNNSNETSDCDNKVTNDDTSNNNSNSNNNNNKLDSKDPNSKISEGSTTSLNNNSNIDNLSNNQYVIATPTPTPTTTTTTATLSNLYKTYNANAYKSMATTTTVASANSQTNLTTTTNPGSLKLDNVQDLIPTLTNQHGLISNVSQSPQSIIHFSNALMQQHYPQLAAAAAATQNLYTDPAQLAKEVAQKNYANALKLAAAAAAQQTNQLSGKPLTAYSSVQALNNKAQQAAAHMYSQQVGQRLQTPMSPTGAPLHLTTLNRQMQNPYQQYMRPQLTPANLTGNPYYPQLINPQSFLYSGLSHVNPQLATQTSAAQQANLASAAGYPFTLNAHQAQTLNHQALNGLSSTMLSHTQVPPISAAAAATATTTPGSAVVLNPYKKMKTS